MSETIVRNARYRAYLERIIKDPYEIEHILDQAMDWSDVIRLAHNTPARVRPPARTLAVKLETYGLHNVDPVKSIINHVFN
jgi:hypothetical protein